METPQTLALQDLKQRAVDAARQAGRLLAARSADYDQISSQDGRDVKMAADLRSEALLAELLAPSGIPVFSEEAGWVSGQDESLRWVVDPLDGTANYSRGTPLCCVSIALMRNDKPLLGVVHDFSRDESFSGIVGIGAWLNDSPMAVNPVPEKRQAILATGFPIRRDFDAASMTAFALEVSQWKKVRMLGSAALSLAYVAAGRFDAYWEERIMPWDVAAGWALVEAAGGQTLAKITALDQPLDLFAAAPPLVQSWRA